MRVMLTCHYRLLHRYRCSLPRRFRKFHIRAPSAVDQPVWGYQRPELFELPDFTPEQLSNRASQPSLVRLVDSYRRHAHRSATLDPLSLTPRPSVSALDPRRYGFGVSSNFIEEVLPKNHISKELPNEMVDDLGDEGKLWAVDGVIGMGIRAPAGAQRTLAEIIQRLEEVYCGRIAYEYMHLPNKSEREWISNELESKGHDLLISDHTKRRYWQLLHRSEAFDKFLGTKFPNVKRYGLEGGESMLVALDRIFEECGTHNVKEVVVAMPHRGRLNFLTQLLSLDLGILIQKLKGKAEIPEEMLSRTPAYTGDVLSHLSTTTDLKYPDWPSERGLKVHVLPNPSHLEAVSPVGLGFARAFSLLNRTGPYTVASGVGQNRIGDDVLSVQIHGDAAFGGQGVVAETLNLNTLPHFTVGGSVRLVLNNQLGYTTPATEGRTSFYATDLAKGSAPVIHVNGEYPEDVSRALALAFAFRNKFRKDVLVDLVVYRRWGHNELDEPTYTSPHMYRSIESLSSVPSRYEKELLEAQTIDQQSIDKLRSKMEREFGAALEGRPGGEGNPTGAKEASSLMDLQTATGNRAYSDEKEISIPKEKDTGVDLARLRATGRASVSIPEDFSVHPRLLKMHIQKRLQALEEGQDGQKAEIDFSTAEALAFGTLLEDGYSVRLSGQDSGRGTFSQRHALLTDQEIEGRTVVPLNELSAENTNRGKLEIVNSPLSEYAVLGFELGLSYMTSRTCLTLWEAQFGDFVNTAQVSVDQFFVSGQFKWPTFDTGLVLLLPHGLDGAGPEHSSCRIERFLQASNEPWSFEGRKTQVGIDGENLSVCNPTTPAQYFHLLRRQMKLATCQRPRGLVVCTPKTLLRARETFSCLAEMGPGTNWRDVCDDPLFKNGHFKESVQRLVICSGKVYYDLVKKRKALEMEAGVGLIRIEELTPFPYQSLHQVIKTYPRLASIVWVQEEPENHGPLRFVVNRIGEVLSKLEHEEPFATETMESAHKPQTKDSSRPRFGFLARPSCASPATGIGERFKAEKEQLEGSVFDLDSVTNQLHY